MKESALRACAGCLSALLGLALVVTSSYHMYMEEVRFVGQQLHARTLLGFAEAADCATVDDSHVGQLIYLRNCELKSTRPLQDIQDGVDAYPLATVGSYTFCPQHKAVTLQIPADAMPKEKLLASTIGELPPACKTGKAAVLDANFNATAWTSRSEQGAAFESVSVIAVQAQGSVLVKVAMEAFDEVTGGVFVVQSGDHSLESMINDLHVPRFAPQWVVIFLVFAGVCGINLGVAEIPGYKIPAPCRVPQFQSCSLSLIATIAVMVTLCLCGTLFGFAWAKYHVLLSVPLFVASLTSLCLLIFVRFRCSYDGYEDEDDEDRKSLLGEQSGTHVSEKD